MNFIFKKKYKFLIKKNYDLNYKFTTNKQKQIIKDLDAHGINFMFNSNTNKNDIILVNKKGNHVLENLQGKNDFIKERYNLFEDLYLKKLETEVDAYDSIILFIYLQEIQFLREYRIYVSEQNVNEMHLEF